jgi:hypothetical protein
VGDALDLLVNAHGHAQFLVQLATETVLKTLAQLAFATGEFPQASEVRARKPLGDEELAGAEDEAGTHLDGITNCELRIANRVRIAWRVLWQIRHSEFAIRDYLPTLL